MLSDAGEDLLVRREAVRLVLRVDASAVQHDVEDAAVPALQTSGNAEFLLDGGLQTGGLWVVVSFGAVGDLDVPGRVLIAAKSPVSAELLLEWEPGLQAR